MRCQKEIRRYVSDRLLKIHQENMFVMQHGMESPHIKRRVFLFVCKRVFTNSVYSVPSVLGFIEVFISMQFGGSIFAKINHVCYRNSITTLCIV